MKYLVSILLTILSVPAAAQWRSVGLGGISGNTAGTIYALGTHDSNVFASTSDGVARYTVKAGWTRADSGINFTQGNVTSFITMGPNIYVSPDNSQITYTTDDGFYWGNKLPAAGPAGTNGRYLFGEFPYGTNIVRSRDGGKTFDSVAHVPVLNFVGWGASVLSTASDGIYRSSDSGGTWSKIPTPPAGLSLSAFASIDSQLFAGGLNVFRSTDLGLHWSPVGTAPLMNRTVHSLASYQTYLFAGTDSGVYISADSGVNWRNVSEGMGAHKGYNPSVTCLTVLDTLLFAAVDAGFSDPAHLGYVTDRSIPEMIADTTASVEQTPPTLDPIDIYPNPSLGTVTIRSEDAPILGVRIIDVLGEVVQCDPNEYAARMSLDISELRASSYFLEITTPRRSELRKFVKE